MAVSGAFERCRNCWNGGDNSHFQVCSKGAESSDFQKQAGRDRDTRKDTGRQSREGRQRRRGRRDRPRREERREGERRGRAKGRGKEKGREREREEGQRQEGRERERDPNDDLTLPSAPFPKERKREKELNSTIWRETDHKCTKAKRWPPKQFL